MIKEDARRGSASPQLRRRRLERDCRRAARDRPVPAGSHPPFDALGVDRVQRVADAVELEYHPAGTTIISRAPSPVEHLRVVRSGAVEIVYDGTRARPARRGRAVRPRLDAVRPADRIRGPRGGGHDLLSDRRRRRAQPAGGSGGAAVRRPLAARATPAELPRPDRERRATRRTSRSARCSRPAGRLRARDVDPRRGRRMSAGGANCAVVDARRRPLGIVTDRDLRTRVARDRVSAATRPVSAAMSAPAYTCRPDRLGGDVLLEMLDRGFRHFPVRVGDGQDARGGRGPRPGRRPHALVVLPAPADRGAAQTVEELAAAARELRPMVIAMHDARVARHEHHGRLLGRRRRAHPPRCSSSQVARRRGKPSATFAWLALGSQARREACRASDVDCARRVVRRRPTRPRSGRRLQALGRQGGRRSGAVRPATRPARGVRVQRRVRPLAVSSWQRRGAQLDRRPDSGEGADARVACSSTAVRSGACTPARRSRTRSGSSARAPVLLRLLARFALSHRPPTGFLRGLVVEHSGEHRGRLDLKHGGVMPIVDLARWAGMAAGVTSASTIERLRAAARPARCRHRDAQTLRGRVRADRRAAARASGQPAARRRAARRLRRSRRSSAR